MGQRLKGFAFAFLGALTVRDVQKREFIVFVVSDCGCDARVHAAGHETDRELWSNCLFGLEHFSGYFFGAAHQTPLTSGPQIYLWSCNCMRTFRPLPVIQFASCCKSTKPHAGEISTACDRFSRSYFSMTLFA